MPYTELGLTIIAVTNNVGVRRKEVDMNIIKNFTFGYKVHLKETCIPRHVVLTARWSQRDLGILLPYFQSHFF